MWFLVGVAVLLAALLTAPIGVDLSIRKDADRAAVNVEGRVRWLGLSKRFGGSPHQRVPAPQQNRPSAARSKRRRGLAVVRALVSTRGFVRRCAQLVADFGRTIRPDRISLYARIGFEDPADTGAWLGWTYAFAAAPLSPEHSSVRLEPDFSGDALEGRLDLHWSRRPIALLWPMLTFAASPNVWRAVRRARAASRVN